MPKDKNGLDTTLQVTAGVGATNWGLVEFLDFNLVTFIADKVTAIPVEPIVYGAVAISGVYLIVKQFL